MSAVYPKTLSDQLFQYFELFRRVDAIYSRLARWSGLSDAAYWVLVAIAEGEKTQKDICEHWDMSKQTVFSALKFLEERDYVQMKTLEQDRRSKVIHLTPKGETFRNEKIAPVWDVELRSFAGLTEKQRDALLRESTRFYEMFEREASLLISGNQEETE